MGKLETLKWQNCSGCINVEADLLESDIPLLAAESEIHTIQFYKFKNPSIDTWNVLNEFFAEHPEIALQILWYNETSWDFLEHLPFLKSLSVNSFLTKDYSVIAEYVDLESLHMGETKSSVVDISFISNLKHLKILSIDGMKKGIDSISGLRMLWSLNLRGIKCKNLSFLEGMDNLRLLKLMYGSISELSSLRKLINLEYLGISRVRDISDFEFLKSLKYLQYLQLEGLSYMERLPDLSGQNHLKKINIDNMLRLENFDSLSQLEDIEELLFRPSLTVKSSVRKHQISRVFNAMKNMSKLKLTNLFDWIETEDSKILTERGVRPYDFDESKWKQNVLGGWVL